MASCRYATTVSSDCQCPRQQLGATTVSASDLNTEPIRSTTAVRSARSSTIKFHVCSHPAGGTLEEAAAAALAAAALAPPGIRVFSVFIARGRFAAGCFGSDGGSATCFGCFSTFSTFSTLIVGWAALALHTSVAAGVKAGRRWLAAPPPPVAAWSRRAEVRRADIAMIRCVRARGC